MPASLAWFAYSTPPEKRGLAMGLGSASYQVGLAIGSTALGLIVQNSGYTFMYFCTSCAVGLSGIIIALSLLKKRTVSPAE
jgi:predicted MFS family arabinose efflux permease